MKAIETSYKGYRFRSRLEARYAVFFDALGVEWEYEPEGFDLGDGVRYLPDFMLKNVGMRSTILNGMWAEIKPDYKLVTEKDETKMLKLGEQTDTPVILLCGEVNNKQENGRYEVYPIWDNYMMWMKCYSCGKLKIDFLESSYYYCDSCGGNADDEHPDIEAAVMAARSARFEYGESGGKVKPARNVRYVTCQEVGKLILSNQMSTAEINKKFESGEWELSKEDKEKIKPLNEWAFRHLK